MRLRSLALLAASALVLVGCGSGSDSESGVADRSADQILSAAKKQVQEQDPVAVKGSGKDSDSSGQIDVDMGFAKETAQGSVALNGMTIELRKADGKSYFKADEKFFESNGTPAEAMDLISGKWVLIDPANASFKEIGSFLSKKAFFDNLLDPETTLSKTATKQVGGVECIGLKSSTGTLYVATDDARPISLVTSEDGKGTLEFSYDDVEEAKAPAAGEVLDLSQLGS